MQRVEDSVDPRVQKVNGRAQLCETAFLLTVMLLVSVSWIVASRWLLAILLPLAVLFLLSAFFYRRKAVQIYDSTEFIINHRRLATLRAASVPDDVMECLRALESQRHGRPFRGEGRFFRRIERALGTERCAEVKTELLKYLVAGN